MPCALTQVPLLKLLILNYMLQFRPSIKQSSKPLKCCIFSDSQSSIEVLGHLIISYNYLEAPQMPYIIEYLSLKKVSSVIYKDKKERASR